MQHRQVGGRCGGVTSPTTRAPAARSPLPRFLLLYGALFAAFGVASPFLPNLMREYGLQPSAIGIVLAAGTAIRLLAGPLGGRLADRSGRSPLVLTGFTLAAAIIATFYAEARGFMLLLLIGLAHATMLAPISPIADALALGSAKGSPDETGGFPYGWVRGAGSAAFIAGDLLAGILVTARGLPIIIWLNAGLLALAAAFGWMLPNRVAGTTDETALAGSRTDGLRSLLRVPHFPLLMLVVALIGGSQAMHDGFEVIRWRTAGMSADRASQLYAVSVAAEVLMFFVLGRPLLARLGPGRALMLSAAAGILRWSAAALTASFSILVFVEPLHGLTFALLHLACMQRIAETVPRHLASTAQAFYATVAVGAFYTAVTLLSGRLYQVFGAGAFWFMAGLCAAALPAAAGLTERKRFFSEKKNGKVSTG